MQYSSTVSGRAIRATSPRLSKLRMNKFRTRSGGSSKVLLARISRSRIRRLGLAEGGSGDDALAVGREGCRSRALQLLDIRNMLEGGFRGD